MSTTTDIRPGDFVVYTRRGTDHRELGRTKRPAPDGHGWFVWYSEGDTAALTPIDCLARCAHQADPMLDGPFDNWFSEPAAIGGEDARRCCADA